MSLTILVVRPRRKGVEVCLVDNGKDRTLYRGGHPWPSGSDQPTPRADLPVAYRQEIRAWALPVAEAMTADDALEAGRETEDQANKGRIKLKVFRDWLRDNPTLFDRHMTFGEARRIMDGVD